MTKSKFKEDNESTVGSTKTAQKPQPIIDFIPGWAKEEKCFRDVTLRDVNTKKIIEEGHQKPTSQWAYENWLSKVVNEETGKQEYSLSKGRLIGYDSGGIQTTTPISYPERWRKTIFQNRRTYNERTGAFTVQTIGPSKTEDVYDLPFSADNVKSLFNMVEDDNVMFILKDLRTDQAREVKWSSVKDTLELFCNKSFDSLWRAEYIPPPVRQELRQEAVAQGLIHGVASDYSATNTTMSDNSKGGGAYT